MQQTFGRTGGELFVHHPKQIRFDGFELKMRSITDAAIIGDLFGATAAEPFGDVTPRRWQRLVGRGGDLGDQTELRLPTNDVSARGDVDVGGVVVARNGSRLGNVKKFRMQGPGKNMKRKFSNFWTNR